MKTKKSVGGLGMKLGPSGDRSPTKKVASKPLGILSEARRRTFS